MLAMSGKQTLPFEKKDTEASKEKERCRFLGKLEAAL